MDRQLSRDDIGMLSTEAKDQVNCIGDAVFTSVVRRRWQLSIVQRVPAVNSSGPGMETPQHCQPGAGGVWCPPEYRGNVTGIGHVAVLYSIFLDRPLPTGGGSAPFAPDRCLVRCAL